MRTGSNAPAGARHSAIARREGVAAAILETGARVDASERQRLAGIARFGDADPRQVQQARGQRRERQEILAIVLEHGDERLRITRTYELKIPRRHLESGDVAGAAQAEQPRLERAERTIVAGPESPRRMQDVEVRQAIARPLDAMECIARLEERRVE